MVPPLNRSELLVIVILRAVGIGGLLAIPAIFLPYSWMNACHELVGLGRMPDAPIVSYLARSLSAFYAMVGAITLCISLDIRRHRPLVTLWAIVVIAMGVVLLGIDLWSGMPTVWTLLEGPPTLAVGLVSFQAQRHVGRPADGK